MYKSEMGIGQGNSQYGPPVPKISEEGPYKLLDNTEHSGNIVRWSAAGH